MELRAALRADPEAAVAALEVLSTAMRAYLGLQAEAGADVVQLFDTWAGLFDRVSYAELCLPAARASLTGISIPTIYFAPGAGHTLDLQRSVGATGYGVDWRIPIDEAWDRLGDVSIQGNVDPAVLRSDLKTIRRRVEDVKRRVAGRPGHIMNLGHGIDRHTPVSNVEAFVEAVRS
jgi:uroporphyrinogen decarboxylase